MAAAENNTDQSVVLRGVRWETYERLLADHQDSSGTRLNYDSEILEIMAPRAPLPSTARLDELGQVVDRPRLLHEPFMALKCQSFPSGAW